MLRQRANKDSMDETIEEQDNDESSDKMTKRSKKTSHWSSRLVTIVYILFVLLIIVYVIAPFCFRYIKIIHHSVVFMNFFNVAAFMDLSKPELDYGLNCTRSFFIDSYDDSYDETRHIQLGVWHVFPKSVISKCQQLKTNPDKEFEDNKMVILYLHGNGGARGGFHRIHLYKVLANDFDAHVVAIDYRGYGDSTYVTPSVNGLTHDAKASYDWLMTRVAKHRIIVWGHSLGTAVAVGFTSHLTPEQSPKAVILEAPFTSLNETIIYHPFATLHSFMPWFQWFFVDPIVQNPDLNFDSLHLIGKVHSHILILHAIDDGIVPFHLGKKLYETALKQRSNSTYQTQMIAFNAVHGYGHKNICKDPELSKIIHNFIKDK